MLVIYLALILIFSFFLIQIFAYLRKNLSILGSGQRTIMMIIFFVIVANLIIMTGLVIYNTYYNNYQMIGEIGMQGEEGPGGEIGPPICPSKNNKQLESC
jgi:hypothetical protein